MAQVSENRKTQYVRLAHYVRQRPAMLGACVLLGLLAIFAVGAGVSGALGLGSLKSEGVLVERSDSDERAGLNGSEGDLEDRDVEGDSDDRKASGASGREDGAEGAIVVDVTGAVRTPSVVSLEEGARVGDAIEAAGGFAEDADAVRVNRAARLQDGQQVYVPRQGESASGVGRAADAPSSAQGESTAQSGQAALVNINFAGIEELDALPGVGPSTASAIVEDREANGPFASIEDLMRVSGIGEKKFQKLKNSICV